MENVFAMIEIEADIFILRSSLQHGKMGQSGSQHKEAWTSTY